MFTAPGMLAVADILPIMCAYIDREERVRFLNSPLAEYLERPRAAILGQTLREVMGDDIYAARMPLVEAARRRCFQREGGHASLPGVCANGK